MNSCHPVHYNHSVLEVIHVLFSREAAIGERPLTADEGAMVTCDVQALRTAQASVVTQNLLVTLVILSMFMVTKSYYNHIRRQMAKCTVFII
ncbi:hypothetical protein BgiBS90_031611, partial [Biomphalaria glabrata]